MSRVLEAGADAVQFPCDEVIASFCTTARPCHSPRLNVYESRGHTLTGQGPSKKDSDSGAIENSYLDLTFEHNSRDGFL